MEKCVSELEQENLRLLEQNHQLQSNVKSLEQQIARAVPLESSFEEMREKYLALQVRAREAETDRDDFKRRLEISLQRIEDLKAEVAQEAVERNVNSNIEVEEIKRRMTEAKKSYEKELEGLKSEVGAREKSLEEAREKLKENESERSAIMKAASQHFATEVTDVERLLELLLIPPPIEEEPIEVAPVEAPKKKHKKKGTEVTKCFQAEAEELKAQLEQVKREMGLELEGLKNRLDRVNDEKEVVEKENARLRESLASVKADVESRELEVKSENLQKVISISEKLKSVTSQLSESERQKALLKKQLAPLLSRIRTLDRELNALKAEHNENKEQTRKLAEERDMLENDYNVLREEHDEIDSANKDLEMRTARLEGEREELKTKLDEKDDQVEKLTLMNDSMARVVAEGNETQENCMKQIESLTIMAEQNARLYESTKKQLEEETQARARAEQVAAQLRDKLLHAKDTVEIPELLGIAALTADGFPVDLAETISNVCANPTLRSPSKLRQIMIIVNEYFKSKQHRLETEVKDLKENQRSKAEVADGFNDFIRRLFPGDATELVDLHVNQKSQERLKEIVDEMRCQRDNSLRQTKEIDTNLVELLLEIGVDDVDAGKAQVAKDRETIAHLKKKLAHTKSEFKKLQAEALAFKQGDHARLKQELARCEKELDNLQEKYETQAKLAKQERQSLQLKYREASQANAELTAKAEALESVINRLYADVGSHKETTAALIAEKSELQELVKRHEKTLKIRDFKEKELKKQLSRLQSDSRPETTENTPTLTEDMQAYVKKCTEAFEARISDMTEVIEKLKKELSITTNQRNTEAQRASDLELRLQKCMLELDLLQKKEAREKTLSDENRRHERVISDGNLRRVTSEMSARLAEAKREVMTTVALQFSSLFDVGLELNERNFVAMLQMVRTRMLEFIAQESRLRRIMSLGPNQSLEAEVSRIVIEKSRLL